LKQQRVCMETRRQRIRFWRSSPLGSMRPHPRSPQKTPGLRVTSRPPGDWAGGGAGAARRDPSLAGWLAADLRRPPLPEERTRPAFGVRVGVDGSGATTWRDRTAGKGRGGAEQRRG
jgi:hypothetical protein